MLKRKKIYITDRFLGETQSPTSPENSLTFCHGTVRKICKTIKNYIRPILGEQPKFYTPLLLKKRKEKIQESTL